MLACRPIEWPEDGPLAEHDPTPVYPGSVVGSCQDCDEPIYIGPKQQQHLAAFPGWPVYCFLCATKHADPNAFIHDLGNTHQPE